MDLDQSCDNASSTDYWCTQSNNRVVDESDSIILEENMELLELDDSYSDKDTISEFNSEMIPDVSVPRPTSVNRRHSLRPQKQSESIKMTLDVSVPIQTSANRRYTLRPQKRTESTDCDEYSVSPVKKRRMSLSKNGYLETIFEHPLSAKNGSLTFLSRTKKKRSISFNEFVTKAKIKHRRLKVKRLNRVNKSKVSKKSSNISVEDVISKLNCLAGSDDDEWVDIKD